uniref:Pulmonary surfactant-associated protein B n=1 Tax=Anthurium amnicola TaxID=1678845 RepID=A0A1D1XM46_9ARAE
MGVRLTFLFLLFVSIDWIYADARTREISDLTVVQVVPGSGSKVHAENVKNEKLCTLCEQFTTQAVEYLNNNKTHTEIVENLHHACFQLHSLKEQCILLVDYYAPLFFVEVGLIRPEVFCKKVNLCQEMPFFHLLKREDSCSICHRTVIDVLTKLRDPDTQLEIIQTLVKACNKVEHFAQECKRLVFEYGPVILINAEKFLETTDICVVIRACKAGDREMDYLSRNILSDA